MFLSPTLSNSLYSYSLQLTLLLLTVTHSNWPRGRILYYLSILKNETTRDCYRISSESFYSFRYGKEKPLHPTKKCRGLGCNNAGKLPLDPLTGCLHGVFGLNLGFKVIIELSLFQSNFFSFVWKRLMQASPWFRSLFCTQVKR